MTRYAIDAAVAVRMSNEGLVLREGDSIVGPASLRSRAMSLLFAQVRAGERTDANARIALEYLTITKMRLLGDRVSRAQAWRIATNLGWEDTADAEYLAVALLQADALVTWDPKLVAGAEALVTVASWEDLAAASA